jgi:succinate-acetate transporter protein
MMFPLFGVYLAGANTLGFLVAALLCARTSTRTEDILFVGLAIAFALLAVNQFVIAAEYSDGSTAFGHLLRLAAFAIALASIVYASYQAHVSRR